MSDARTVDDVLREYEDAEFIGASDCAYDHDRMAERIIALETRLATLTRPTSEGREDAIPDEWSSDSAYRRRGRQ